MNKRRDDQLTDGGEGTVGDTAADGTGQGEAGVEGSASGGNSSLSLDGGHDEIMEESGEGLVREGKERSKKKGRTTP